MLGLFLYNSIIYFRIISFDFYDTDIEWNVRNELKIQNTLNYNYSYAFFSNNNTIYWMIYNDNTDLVNGYLTYNINIDNYSINRIVSISNNISPLIFLNQIEIKTLKSIKKTKYVYYELIDNQNIIYRGIIDISINKVVFNTNEDFNDFEPFSRYSMLLINNKSAYEICIIKEDGKCIEKCENEKILIFNSDEGNYCSSKESCNNYILLPDNICIDICNENYYIIKDNKCGICKDMNTKEIYTLIKEKKCLSSKPYNTYYINEELKIL
jgi:hypothetical protein